MLMLSLLITMAVQAVASACGLRGRHLFRGVRQLVQRMQPRETAAQPDDASETAEPSAAAKQAADEKRVPDAKTVAGGILNHTVLADGFNWPRKVFGKGRWGPSHIRWEEIVLVLEELQSDGGSDVREALGRVLPQRPGATMKELAAGAEGWYDTVMDAAADRFKLWSRWWTGAFAVLLAFGLQVDSVDILNQLSSSETRAEVLAQIDGINEVYDSLYDEALEDAEQAAPDGEDPAQQKLAALKKAGQQIDQSLQASGLTLFHAEGWDFKKRWWGFDQAWWDAWWEQFKQRFVGMLMTAALLSLGAPFWYGSLRKLVGFRSAVAQRIEKTNGKPGGDQQQPTV